MKRNTSVTLDEDLDRFVTSQVESGAYPSASAVMREALTRMAEEEARKEQYVREALGAALECRVTYSSEESWKLVEEAVSAARAAQGKR